MSSLGRCRISFFFANVNGPDPHYLHPPGQDGLEEVSQDHSRGDLGCSQSGLPCTSAPESCACAAKRRKSLPAIFEQGGQSARARFPLCNLVAEKPGDVAGQNTLSEKVENGVQSMTAKAGLSKDS